MYHFTPEDKVSSIHAAVEKYNKVTIHFTEFSNTQRPTAEWAVRPTSVRQEFCKFGRRYDFSNVHGKYEKSGGAVLIFRHGPLRHTSVIYDMAGFEQYNPTTYLLKSNGLLFWILLGAEGTKEPAVRQLKYSDYNGASTTAGQIACLSRIFVKHGFYELFWYDTCVVGTDSLGNTMLLGSATSEILKDKVDHFFQNANPAHASAGCLKLSVCI